MGPDYYLFFLLICRCSSLWFLFPDSFFHSPLCFSRSGDIIEPLLRNQWFVRCDVMAKKAVQVSLQLYRFHDLLSKVKFVKKFLGHYRHGGVVFPGQAVEERRLEIIPEYYTKTWKNWLSNIRLCGSVCRQ